MLIYWSLSWTKLSSVREGAFNLSEDYDSQPSDEERDRHSQDPLGKSFGFIWDIKGCIGLSADHTTTCPDHDYA